MCIHKKIRSLLLSLVTSLPLIICATNHSQIENPADSLYEKAGAILLTNDVVFSQTDLNNATYKETRVIKVLNKHGDGYANFYSYGDKFKELKSFSGVIRNASGDIIRKINKKDLTISSMSEHLGSDNHSIIYEYKASAYPYMVEYTIEEKWKNGIMAYPSFYPQTGYIISTVEAHLRIELPENMHLRYNSNFDCKIKEETTNNKHVYTFSANNIKAIENEPLSPPFRDIVPRVLIAPSNFCYDSFCGDFSDWNSYGFWVSGLLKDRDILPDNIKAHLHTLIQDTKNDREKVERIYKYLQENSRYVSVQLGIGGFQPIDAAYTLKNNYGDCKGLSNLMKALLKAVDIPSNYCEIYLGNRKAFTKDFANAAETNHAILLVPLQNDSIWLECTSQRIPFGYIHDKIAGHDVLVITEDGGKLCRLPSYADKQNKTKSVLTLDISEDGSVEGHVYLEEHLHQYNIVSYSVASKERNKIIDYINKSVRFPKVEISNINVTEDKSALPYCTVSADLKISEFINKTGSRLFMPLCPIIKGNYNVFTSKSRKFDIEINNGYFESDSIIINIPTSYQPESLPKDISLKTPYGELETIIKKEGERLIYIQNIEVFSGKYDKSHYESIQKFFGAIASAINRKLVLRTTSL